MTDAEWVRKARKWLGCTQAELAAALHVTQGLISRLERGLARLTRRTRAQIEALLVEHTGIYGSYPERKTTSEGAAGGSDGTRQ